LGEFGRFPLFVDRVRAISLYYNRLLRLRDSGRLVSLAFEDSVRLAEEVEFTCYIVVMALPESCSPPTLVRSWFGDAIPILGRAYIGVHVSAHFQSAILRLFVNIIIYAAPVSDWTTQTGVHEGHL
jgi:hypothetical protein